MCEIRRFLTILELSKYKPTKRCIHKHLYIIQNKFIDLEYPFKIQFYGVYSLDIDIDLSTLEFDNLIEIGDYIYITSKGRKFLEKYKDKSIESIVRNFISMMDNMNIELIGNILYFINIGLSRDDIIGAMNLIKPKFTKQEIESGYEFIINNLLEVI